MKDERSEGEDEAFMNTPLEAGANSNHALITLSPEKAGIEETRREKLRNFNIRIMGELHHNSFDEENMVSPQVDLSIDLNKSFGPLSPGPKFPGSAPGDNDRKSWVYIG